MSDIIDVMPNEKCGIQDPHIILTYIRYTHTYQPLSPSLTIGGLNENLSRLFTVYSILFLKHIQAQAHILLFLIKF